MRTSASSRPGDKAAGASAANNLCRYPPLPLGGMVARAGGPRQAARSGLREPVATARMLQKPPSQPSLSLAHPLRSPPPQPCVLCVSASGVSCEAPRLAAAAPCTTGVGVSPGGGASRGHDTKGTEHRRGAQVHLQTGLLGGGRETELGCSGGPGTQMHEAPGRHRAPAVAGGLKALPEAAGRFASQRVAAGQRRVGGAGTSGLKPGGRGEGRANRKEPPWQWARYPHTSQALAARTNSAGPLSDFARAPCCSTGSVYNPSRPG
jgi:hypothetical protein